jgi:hypothetical protein
MTLSSPLNTQQLELESTTTLESQLQQSLSQEEIGQKYIEYLGEPRKQGDDFKKGWQGEVIAFNKLARLGYDVRFEKPCHYDFTIHGDKGITRVQVKTFSDVCVTKNDKVYYYKNISVKKSKDCTTKEPYLLTDFDFLAAVDVETEEVFLVPIREIKSNQNLGKTKFSITKRSISSYKI